MKKKVMKKKQKKIMKKKIMKKKSMKKKVMKKKVMKKKLISYKQKLYEDANKALDSLQAAEEKRNDQIVTVLSVLFALFGIFGIANNLNDWLGTVFNGNYMNIINIITFSSPFIMLAVAIFLLVIKNINKD